MLDLKTFDYEDHAVRVVEIDGAPWFVAAAVCRILGIANPTQALVRLDDDEVQVINVNTVSISEGIRGNPNMNVISESGLYSLVFTSTKPEAKAFRKWVTSEVLPSLRQNGQYRILGWCIMRDLTNLILFTGLSPAIEICNKHRETQHA